MSKVSPIRIPFRPDGKGFKADLIPQRGQALFAKNVAETMDLFRGQIQGFQSDLSKMVQKSSIDRSLQAIGNVLGTKVATFEDIYQGDWRKSPFKSLTRFDLSMFSLLENPEDAFRAIANRPHRFPVYVSWSLCPDSSNEEELRVSLLFSKRMSIEVGEPDDINGSRSFPLRKDVNSAFAKTRKRVAPLLAMNMNPAGDLLVPPKKESVAQGLVSEALNLENIILQGSKLEVLLDDCSERIWYANHNTYLSPQEVRVLLERVFMVKRWSKGDLVKGADRMATNLVARTKYLFVGFDQVVLYDGNRRSICEIKLDSEEKDRILGLVIKKPDRPRGEEAELREVMEADFSGRSADKYSNYVMRLLINDLHQRSEGEKKHKHFSVFDRLTEKISKEYGKEVVFRFSENQVFALPYTGEVKDPHQPEYLFVVERILSGLPKWLLNVLPQKVVVSGPLFNYATYDKRRGKETYEIVISQRQDVSFLHDGEIFIDSRHGSLEFPQEFIFALYRKENRTETLTHLSENLSEYYYRQIMTAAERRA